MRIPMAVNVGDQAPKFELVDGDLKFRSLDEFKGKKVVISFSLQPVLQYVKLNFVNSEIH